MHELRSRPQATAPAAAPSQIVAAILAAFRDPQHGAVLRNAVMDLIFDDLIETIDIRLAKGHTADDSRTTTQSSSSDADEAAPPDDVGDANEEWIPHAAGDDAAELPD